jgi:mycoredoxin
VRLWCKRLQLFSVSIEEKFEMSKPTENGQITLYTSNWCAHALSVEGFLDKYDIPVKMINIDGDREARERLIEINGGYASVPTLIFPDGSKLTEPSFGELREKLSIEPPPSVVQRIKELIGRDEGNSS